MPADLPARFRRWFEYERDAHARVMDSLETIPEDRRSGSEYRKAVDLLAHIVAARRNWLARIAGGASVPVFPRDARIEDVVADRADVEALWTAYFGRLDDAELARVVEYRLSDGSAGSDSVEDLLVHLYGHFHYHRGQIATLVRAAGGEPAAIEFVHWLLRSG